MTNAARKENRRARPLVAIVGRPNVGKSTLFNRLTGRQTAIVDDIPGVTRDRIYGEVEWDGQTFDIVDTGGLVTRKSDSIQQAVYKQIVRAVHDAGCIIFVTDILDGLLPGDEDVAEVLRQTGKHVIVVANKADNQQRALAASEMYALGFDEPHPISALHGLGIDGLLDRVLEAIPEHPGTTQDLIALRIAIVGQPNVGKSSLVNALLNEERVIVDEKAGTTRDSVDIHFHRKDKRYVLVDTAGLKRPGKVEPGVERYSVKRALASIRRCDIALLLIDASVAGRGRAYGMTEQDARIANRIDAEGRAQLIALNKWDLVERDSRTFDIMAGSIRSKMPNLAYVPILSVSAKTRLRLQKLFEELERAHENHSRRIPTSELNEFMREVIRANPPRMKRGTLPKLLYVTQAAIAPPTFVLFMNRAEPLDKTYLRYIENQLRGQFDFSGAPIKLEIRRKPRS